MDIEREIRALALRAAMRTDAKTAYDILSVAHTFETYVRLGYDEVERLTREYLEAEEAGAREVAAEFELWAANAAAVVVPVAGDAEPAPADDAPAATIPPMDDDGPEAGAPVH